MDFSRIYTIQIGTKRTSLHVRPRDNIADDLALYQGRLKPSRPLQFEYMKGASGSKARDFVSTSLVPLTLISDRVLEVLAAFTGWTTYPVEVYGKNDERIPGYHGLAVTGRCGPIEDSKSRPVMRPPAVPHGRWTRWWVGLYFDPSTWDGSSIFVPDGTGLTFVVEELKRAVERAKITNVTFTPLTEADNMSSALLFGMKKK